MGLNQATFMTSAIPKILAHAPWMAGVWNLGIASVTPGRKPPQPAESHQGRGQRDDCSLCRPFRTFLVVRHLVRLFHQPAVCSLRFGITIAI